MQEAEQLFAENREREKQLLVKFKQEQDHFVRIDWYGEVFFPHEILWKNIGLLQDTINALEQSDVDNALEKFIRWITMRMRLCLMNMSTAILRIMCSTSRRSV